MGGGSDASGVGNEACAVEMVEVMSGVRVGTFAVGMYDGFDVVVINKRWCSCWKCCRKHQWVLLG